MVEEPKICLGAVFVPALTLSERAGNLWPLERINCISALCNDPLQLFAGTFRWWRKNLLIAPFLLDEACWRGRCRPSGLDYLMLTPQHETVTLRLNLAQLRRHDDRNISLVIHLATKDRNCPAFSLPDCMYAAVIGPQLSPWRISAATC